MTVLDASALLAFLFREAGHERVAEVIEDSCMSTVNLAEVMTRFTRDGHAASAVLAHLRRSAIAWVPLAEDHAAVVAELAPVTFAVCIRASPPLALISLTRGCRHGASSKLSCICISKRSSLRSVRRAAKKAPTS